jgi:phosphoglycerol transferase MdoB-like AlkP superfamily enzyme
MAIGIGHMFNLRLPQNFNSPFRSKSVIEFWTRWHITLSQFIGTYVFTPMLRAMPKITFRNTMIATFLSMLLAGVWHGAGGTFVIYGALHGLGLVANHRWKKKKKRLPGWLAWFLTFNFVNLTLVVFRARTLADAGKVLAGMLGFSGVVVPKIGVKSVGPLKDFGFEIGTYLYPNDYLLILALVATFFVIHRSRNSLELEAQVRPGGKLGVVAGVAFVVCLFGMNRITEFIYFNF